MVLSASRFFSVTVLLGVLLCPQHEALAAQCQDAPQGGTEGGRSTDCANYEAGAAQLKVLVSCIGERQNNNWAFRSLTLLKATKSRQLDGQVVTLSKVFVVDINFGEEHQKWLFENGAATVGASSAVLTGKRKEVAIYDSKKKTSATAIDGDPNTLEIFFKAGTSERVPTRIRLGKMSFACASGRFDLGGWL